MLPSAPLSAPRYLKLYPDKPSAATPKRAICLRFWGTGTLPRRSASRQSRAPLGFPEPERRRDGGCLKCHPGGFRVFFFLFFFFSIPSLCRGLCWKGSCGDPREASAIFRRGPSLSQPAHGSRSCDPNPSRLAPGGGLPPGPNFAEHPRGKGGEKARGRAEPGRAGPGAALRGRAEAPQI